MIGSLTIGPLIIKALIFHQEDHKHLDMDQQDSDDDFQRPRSFNARFDDLIDNIGALKEFSRQSNPQPKRQRREPKPRGPKPIVVKLKPKLKRKDPQIAIHQSHGYGYPASTYNDFSSSMIPFQLSLTDAEFKVRIQSLYDKLAGRDFKLFTVDNNRRLKEAPMQTSFFKTSNYKGTTIIKIDNLQLEPQTTAVTQPTGTLSEHQLQQRTSIASVIPAETSVHRRAATSRSIPTPAATSRSIPTPAATSRSVTTPAATSTSTPADTSRSVPRTVATPTSVPTPVATSVPTTVATSVSHGRVPSPTETNTSEICPPSPANSSIRADNEISFNPTIRLRLQQDLEFAASLAMDQDKDTQVQQARLRRDMERLERRRQRQRRIEEREQEHTKILDEIAEMKSTARPDDLCNIIFVLPSETEERRIVPKTCSSEKLHLYVEAATTVEVPRLIFCGSVIENDEKPIKDHGIDRNCRVIVEETLQIEVSDTEDDDEIIHDTEPRTVNLLEMKDLTEFEQRRETVLTNLLPSVELSIRRDYILQDVLDAYTLNPNIVHHRLDVRFEGETGLDLAGVTREMFSTVLQLIMKKFFIGNAQKVPGLDHRHIFSGVYTTIGLIISHSVVLVNYFPPDLSPAVFSILGCGSCSNEMVMNCFLAFISEDDRRLIRRAIDSESFPDELHLRLVNFMGDYDGRVKLTPTNLKSTVLEVARMTLVAKPLYPMSNIHKGLSCYPLLWEGMTENMVAEMMERARPTAQQTIDMMDYQFSDDVVLRSLEERVKSFFERYVASLMTNDVRNLLKFWTSADTLCVSALHVVFNSNEGLLQRPMANTCAATLQISRMYLSFEQLSADFHQYLQDPSSFVFDTI